MYVTCCSNSCCVCWSLCVTHAHAMLLTVHCVEEKIEITRTVLTITIFCLGRIKGCKASKLECKPARTNQPMSPRLYLYVKCTLPLSSVPFV